MDVRTHWEQIYATREAAKRSWTAPVPTTSLALIARCRLPLVAPIIDVGAGASNLVDHLLDAGYTDLTVLDLAEAALHESQSRLGERAAGVQWIAADLLQFVPLRTYELWHDRAVFHFLTGSADRERYRAVLEAAVAPGGHAIIATFALDGPESCSGLPVCRYDANTLMAELGSSWELLESRADFHETPWGTEQSFIFGLFRRVG